LELRSHSFTRGVIGSFTGRALHHKVAQTEVNGRSIGQLFVFEIIYIADTVRKEKSVNDLMADLLRMGSSKPRIPGLSSISTNLHPINRIAELLPWNIPELRTIHIPTKA
jgi:hypothetical protein